MLIMVQKREVKRIKLTNVCLTMTGVLKMHVLYWTRLGTVDYV